MWAGFELWVPPTAPDNGGFPVFEIIGTDCQIVQFPLQAGESITCEPGAMCYMNDGCKMRTTVGSLTNMVMGAIGGESIFKCIYTNNTSGPGYVAMTSDIPGVIVPINMQECGTIKCKLGAWLCSTGNMETQVAAGFNPAQSIAGACCGGMNFIVQELSGGSWSFLAAMGTIISRDLEAGEEMIVDTNSILAMSGDVSLDVRAVGGIGAMCCAGEGAFNTVLTGPGKVWLESMPIEKLRSLFPAPSNGGGGGGDNNDSGGGGE